MCSDVEGVQRQAAVRSRRLWKVQGFEGFALVPLIVCALVDHVHGVARLFPSVKKRVTLRESGDLADNGISQDEILEEAEKAGVELVD